MDNTDIELRRITRAEARDQGFTDRQLAQLIRTGRLHRVRPGEYALPTEWNALERHRQHRELVLRTAERVTAPQVYSHFAAAALWGMRIRRNWPTRVDVIVDRTHGGRSSGRLRRRAVGFDGREIVEKEGLLLTSPAQTVVDLARELPFVDAVVVADSAFGTAFGRAALTTNSELIERLADARTARGVGRARAVLAEADGRAESPPETESRIATVLLGFPRPDLQREFATGIGIRRVDMWWEHFGQAGECDGRAKYRDPAYLKGRDPVDVFRREKERDRALLSLPAVRGITHWEPADLHDLGRFYDILRGAGLPTSMPRPTATTLDHAQSLLLRTASTRFRR